MALMALAWPTSNYHHNLIIPLAFWTNSITNHQKSSYNHVMSDANGNHTNDTLSEPEFCKLSNYSVYIILTYILLLRSNGSLIIAQEVLLYKLLSNLSDKSFAITILHYPLTHSFSLKRYNSLTLKPSNPKYIC